MSIPDAIGKTNPFSGYGGGNATTLPSEAGGALKFGGFARLVASDELFDSANAIQAGGNLFVASNSAERPFDRSLLQGLIALQREGDLGRLLAAGVPRISPQDEAIAFPIAPAVSGLSDNAAASEEISLDPLLSEPGGLEDGGIEESADGADLQPVAAVLDGAVGRPPVESDFGGGRTLTAGSITAPAANLETPETSPDVASNAASPLQTGAPLEAKFPVPETGSGRIADNAASPAPQPLASGSALQAAPLSAQAGDEALSSPKGGDAAGNAVPAGGAAKTTPADLPKVEGTANLFGQSRAAEVRSEKADQALAKVHGDGTPPAGIIDDPADGTGETVAAQSARPAVGKNDSAVQPAAAGAGAPLVSSLNDPRLKAEAAATEVENAEVGEAADVAGEGEERKAEKGEAHGASVNKDTSEAQAPRRSGVSGAALAFAAAVRSDPLDGTAQGDAAVDFPDSVGFQSSPVDAATARPASQATQQLPHAAQVAPQVAVQIARHTAQGNSRFQIRLHPEELGGVDVELKITSDGVVKAHLTVERSETLDLFLRDQRGLERALDAAGLKVDSETLQFSLKDQGNSQFSAQGERDGQSGGRAGDGQQPSASDQGDALSASSAGRAYVRGASGALDVQV